LPQPGVLICIKATLTGDQFFDTSQFESYRERGRHIRLKVFAPLGSPLTPNAARTMRSEEIRDALALRLPDHPVLQANKAWVQASIPSWSQA